MKVALIGANGQLGSDIQREWIGVEITPLTRAEVDVTDRERVMACLRALAPDLVINTAAYHNVDLCEQQPERAFAVNATGAMNVADACRETESALMFLSTDYVFSGASGLPYVETDLPDPVNVYGVSKAAGEQLIRQRLERHFIVRTSGLYGVAGSSGKGGNFIERMLQLHAEGRAISVVDDQELSPTYTADLARKLLEVVRSDGYGTYHVTNAESCSWHDFAAAAFALPGRPANLSRTTTEAFGAPARRPAFSPLANARLDAAGIPPLRPWREALEDYLVAKGHISRPEEVSGGRR
jgi:dTDP-4-dehydrorhamnose reductase